MDDSVATQASLTSPKDPELHARHAYNPNSIPESESGHNQVVHALNNNFVNLQIPSLPSSTPFLQHPLLVVISSILP
jgi:hypothetical protein